MNKLLLYLLVLIFTINKVNAQLQPHNTQIPFNGYTSKSKIQNLSRSSSCVDTVEFTIQKATGIKTTAINNTTSASAAGQYFDCPQSITIHGLLFYAYSNSLPQVNCTVEIYNAGPDSLPLGTPLASVNVIIDSAFNGGDLDTLEKIANFSSPITLNSPYVLVFNNNSANSVVLLSNDYQFNDGASEWLSSIKVSNTWIRSYHINIGGNNFNADWLFYPIVSYQLESSFSFNNYCIPTTVNFTNNSSPILENRMYNLAQYHNIPYISYTWNYGDGTIEKLFVNPSHSFSTEGPYSVNLTDTIYGGRSICFTDTTKIIDGRVTKPAFKDSISGLTVYFTDTTNYHFDPHTSWLWDFGDGSTSISQNPNYTYASSGIYSICLTATGNCGTDSSCRVINLNLTDMDEVNRNDVKIYPNPAETNLTIETKIQKQVFVVDVTGRKLNSFNLNQSKVIDISDLKQGYYFITDEFGNKLTKFMKL